LFLALGTVAQATPFFDVFATDPNIGTEWTEYSYYNAEDVTPAWDGTAQDLDLVNSGAGTGAVLGLYRSSSSRSATDPVTLTVKDLSRTGGTWGYSGLMISSVPQPGYVTTTDDTYTLALVALGARALGMR
jgi:hypothetical protein